jgi:hypothetical protein
VKKTAQDIVEEINNLKASSQAPQLNTILEKLLCLAEAVAVLERNLPECDAGTIQDVF